LRFIPDPVVAADEEPPTASELPREILGLGLGPGFRRATDEERGGTLALPLWFSEALRASPTF